MAPQPKVLPALQEAMAYAKQLRLPIKIPSPEQQQAIVESIAGNPNITNLTTAYISVLRDPGGPERILREKLAGEPTETPVENRGPLAGKPEAHWVDRLDDMMSSLPGRFT